MSQTLLKSINTSNRTPVCQSLTSVYNIMVSFGTKIRLIPNVSHACTLVGLCNKIYMLLILPYTQKIRLKDTVRSLSVVSNNPDYLQNYEKYLKTKKIS